MKKLPKKMFIYQFERSTNVHDSRFHYFAKKKIYFSKILKRIIQNPNISDFSPKILINKTQLQIASFNYFPYALWYPAAC